MLLVSNSYSMAQSSYHNHIIRLSSRKTKTLLTVRALPGARRSPAAATAAKLLQSCPTLCDPMDCSLPGSPVPGILQARTLEWVAISFSSAWKWKVKVKSLSHIWLFATPWTAAHQAPPSMGFSGQQCWSRVPLPSLEITYQLPSTKSRCQWIPVLVRALFRPCRYPPSSCVLMCCGERVCLR